MGTVFRLSNVEVHIIVDNLIPTLFYTTTTITSTERILLRRYPRQYFSFHHVRICHSRSRSLLADCTHNRTRSQRPTQRPHFQSSHIRSARDAGSALVRQPCTALTTVGLICAGNCPRALQCCQRQCWQSHTVHAYRTRNIHARPTFWKSCA